MYYIISIAIIVILVLHGRRISALERKTGIRQTPVVLRNQVAQKSSEKTSPETKTDAVIQTPANPAVNVSRPVARLKYSEEENTGHILGIIGVVAVLVGIAFFLQYAFSHNLITPAGRVILGIVAGVAFLGIGQWLRKKYVRYSDILMGGGIGILYLSIFAAYSFYELIDFPTAFVVMFCITALSIVISVVHATQTLSVVGIFGGFFTPILLGISGETMFELFTYLTVLNIGVLGVAIFKKWQPLVYLGFVGTILNFAPWFQAYYTENDLMPVFLFTFVTFIIFLAASIAHNIKARVTATAGDYSLITANAACFAGLSYFLLEPDFSGIVAFGAVGLAVVYLVVANLVNKFHSEDRALNIFLSGTGVVFLTIAVPLQFGGTWITLAWLAEALLIYITAVYVQNRGFQIMGACVYAIGLARFVFIDVVTLAPIDFVMIFNKVFLLGVISIVIAYIIAYIYDKYGSINLSIQKRGVVAFVVIANILTLFVLTHQVAFYFENQIAEDIEINSEAFKQCIIQYGDDADVYGKCRQYDLKVISGRDFLYNGYNNDLEYLSLINTSNTLVSILWALYAVALIAIGFAKRLVSIRRMGLILFAVTAIKVFVDIWSFGVTYRIISLIVFGLIALIGSFMYAKYRGRIKDMI